MGWLGERYRVEFSQGIFARHGFLAGDDARRAEELSQALRDPDLGAIVAARGGYGLTRILPGLDTSDLAKHPKWLVGFSDFTALHVRAVQQGVMTLHAHNVAGLGRGDHHARQAWLEALEAPTRERALRGLTPWRDGSAEGPLFGGNLTVLHALAAAGTLVAPAGCILFLEDVTETSYRIDRMLSGLIQAGHFSNLGGVVLGEFTDCSQGKYGVPTEQVLRERLTSLHIPVWAGLACGHGRHNAPLTLGAPSWLDPASRSLRINPVALRR
jgi:muramoyltetrapeptide carboxypeptidase